MGSSTTEGAGKRKRPKAYTRQYPWRDWMRRGRTRIVAGRDYHCTTLGMVQNIRAYVRRNRLKVSLQVRDGYIVLSFLKEG